jgi:carbon monoxide dehydrogenase subunit G
MVRFEGDRDLPLAPADIWSKLSDARFLLQCISDVQAVSSATPDKVVCTLRPGFAFVRGTLELTLQVDSAGPEKPIGVRMHTRGIGSTSEVAAALVVSPQGNGMRLHWGVEVVRLDGLLKAVPQGLVQAAAQKVIADALTAVEGRLKS